MEAGTLQSLLDRQLITDLLYRYASAVDRKDFATIKSLFTDDAHGSYAGVAELEGAEAITRWIDDMTADKAWQHHLISVYHVDFTGPDEAEALTYHTSHQTDIGDEGAVTVIVSRYHDTVRRTEGTWKIARKVMEKGWVEQRRPAPVAR